jgi:hypothetical protein
VLTLKADVQLKLLDPHIVLADQVVASIYAKYGLVVCQITSGTEGTHMVGSKHYTGEAHDYSTLLVPAGMLSTLVQELSTALPGYHVLYEGPTQPVMLPASLYMAAPVPHLHVEWHPAY